MRSLTKKLYFFCNLRGRLVLLLLGCFIYTYGLIKYILVYFSIGSLSYSRLHSNMLTSEALLFEKISNIPM